MADPFALVVTLKGTPVALPRARSIPGRRRPVSLTGKAKIYAAALERAARAAVLEAGTDAVQLAFARQGLSVSILWHFKTPHAGLWGTLHTKKPDHDNLLKMDLDCLERAGALAGNDCRVAVATAEKQWARAAGVMIRVEAGGAGKLSAPAGWLEK